MQIKLIWDTTDATGCIIAVGCLIGPRGAGQPSVPIAMDERGAMVLEVTASDDLCGNGMSCLSIVCDAGAFTVRTADITMDHPVYIPAYRVIVTEGRDERTFGQIAAEIRGRGLQTELAAIEQDAEETYEEAARDNLSLHGPVWLGLGRDMRIFSVDMRQSEDDPWSWVEPRYAGKEVELPENKGRGVRYQYTVGRGISCVHDYSRRLYGGSLPILVKTVRDKDMVYETTVFVSLERLPLTERTNRGTHYLVADHFGAGCILTDEQQTRMQGMLAGELNRDEETVAYMRTVIRNTGKVPRYGWYKSPYPVFFDHKRCNTKSDYRFEQGYGAYGPDRVFCVVKLGDRPLPQEEISVLVMPGEKICIDAAIPHMPVSRERAKALMDQDFGERLAECVDYWEAKQSAGARIQVPESIVDEMIRAGLFHLDIATYGIEPSGTLSPTIGVYSALASESWPIILYYESMGWHDVAARCIRYFYEKQHDDGFMQNFGHYMLETGVALWFTAEHYYHTRDREWLWSLMPGIRRAVEYLLAWRGRNKREQLRGRGYGMLEGRSTDTPDDEQRMYLLNALTYKGLDHICRACRTLDEAYWEPVCAEVAAYRQDIRASVADNMARGPVVPLGDGTWCPTMAPWADGSGPVSHLNDGKNWYTHGMFVARDAHMHQLMFCEILERDELFAEFIMDYQCEQFYVKNVRPSQPYYSRHPYLHLLRSESKAFIRNYYNALTSLADRETYSFWEHYFHASPHKTHEEGCFLMESRWMLYLEDGDTLRLLMGVPGKWMEQGRRITVTDASSHFGHLSLAAESRLNEKLINVDVSFADADRLPRKIYLRIPHPQWKEPAIMEGGVYDVKMKCVVIEPVAQRIRVRAKFE